jgi:hypothetical protein
MSQICETNLMDHWCRVKNERKKIGNCVLLHNNVLKVSYMSSWLLTFVINIRGTLSLA